MKHRPWYSRKRILLPVGFLTALVLALVGAVVRSDVSRVMVFNETGEPLAPFRLTACGQSKTFPGVPAEGSVRWKLAGQGDASEIEFELAVEPPVRWRGAYVEARGGYLVTLRVWPDGQVEAHEQISFWQRALKGAPNLNE